MAQERPVTPERQLLRLIEDPKGQKKPGVTGHAVKRKNLSLFSVGAWLGRLSFFKGRFKQWSKVARPKQLDLKHINGILAVCVFILALYFIYGFTMSMLNLGKKPDLGLKIEKAEGALTTPTVTSLKSSVSYYLESVRRRSIFEMREKAPTEEISVVRDKSKILKATEHLKLVGISWSSDPVAMIEDKRIPKTFFSKRGGMVGDVKVQAIYKDKVILSFGGEETELK